MTTARNVTVSGRLDARVERKLKPSLPLFHKVRILFAATLSAIALPASNAFAIDEIQVYNAGIADVDQWTLEEHLNYVARGRTQPDFPGALISDHSINGIPELAYGVTEWWELGLYAPFAFAQNGQGFADGAKLRTLFVSPHADKSEFFYGANFEFSYSTPKFSQTRGGLEIRPIIGVRRDGFEFIVNPIVDVGFGRNGVASFAPAVRLAREIAKETWLGLEYYADFGQIGQFAPGAKQQHALFAVTDFKLGPFDVNFGVGHGFTGGSDRLVFKAILGYAFPVSPQTALFRPIFERLR